LSPSHFFHFACFAARLALARDIHSLSLLHLKSIDNTSLDSLLSIEPRSHSSYNF
jgi:hypothetical protein